jgi:putative lipoic acid-binding regulatory protein
MLLWYEVLQIAQTIQVSDDEDKLIWKLGSNGCYNVKSLYIVVNFRGILPVYIQNVWEIKVPPKFQLWLMGHNRILTRDNLVKTQKKLCG